VKFPAPNAYTQLLVNELLAGILIREYGLTGVEPALVSLPEFVDGERELPAGHVGRLRDGRAAFAQVQCVASLYEPDTREFGDWMDPRAQFEDRQNWETILGAVVFDTWVFNEDARQLLARQTPTGKWDLLLFDNEGAFNRNDWRLHPRCRASTKSGGLNRRLEEMVKERNLAPFESHIRRLEQSLDRQALCDAVSFIPGEWLKSERLDPRRPYGLNGLIDALNRRRRQVREIFQEGSL